MTKFTAKEKIQAALRYLEGKVGNILPNLLNRDSKAEAPNEK